MKKQKAPDSTKLNESKKKSSKLFKKSKKKPDKNSSPTEPTTALNSSPTATTGGNTDEFKKAVEESKVAVAEAAQKPGKGRRGRPSLPRDAAGNVIRNTGASNGATPSVGAQTHSPSASGFQSKDILVEPLITISKVPAKRHDIPELALDQDQAMAIAGAVDKIVDAFMPDLEKLSPKKTAIIFGCFTIGGITLSKYLIYAQTMNERMEREREHEKREAVSRGPEENSVREGHAVVSTQEIPRRTSKPNAFKKPDPFATA